MIRFYKINMFLSILFLLIGIDLYGQHKDVEKVMQLHREYLMPRLNGEMETMNIIFGDLNNDEIDDALVDYCIGGTYDSDFTDGNAVLSLEYCTIKGISVYIKEGKNYILKADVETSKFRDDECLFTPDTIEKGSIICSCLEYSDEDPRCCPSINKSIYLIYHNNMIVKPEQEVKVRREKY